MTLTIDPSVPVELAAARDGMRPVLTGVALQKYGRQHVLAATDSYIAAVVPVKNATGKDASTKDTLIPAGALVEHRKHLQATKGKGVFKNIPNGTATLAVDRDTVTIEHQDGTTTTKRATRIEQGTINGNPVNLRQIIHAPGIEYGQIRVGVNAAFIMRLARAIGAVHGRGRHLHAGIVLDLPHDADGVVNPLKPIRVYPNSGSSGAFGVVMPVHLGDGAYTPCI